MYRIGADVPGNYTAYNKDRPDTYGSIILETARVRDPHPCTLELSSFCKIADFSFSCRM
jgi:hypothetical protein